MTYTASDILQDPKLLSSFSLKDHVIISCSECQSHFSLTKRKIQVRLNGSVGKGLYCTNECRNTATHKTKGTETKIEMQCHHCHTPILVFPSRQKNSKTGKFFCSQSCSASYTNTLRSTEKKKESGLKTSKTLKDRYSKNPRKKSYDKASYNPKTHSLTCEVCSSSFVGRKETKTCSPSCRSELIRKSALSQTKHGGGKKGIYGGFQCDSSYELAFVIYHLDKGSNIVPCTEIRSYIHNGVVSKYNPDFIVDGLIYEIKGFMSERAKSKARDNPDIIVIDNDGIVPYIQYVKDTYNVKNITDLYQTKEYKRYTCEYCSNEFDRKYKTQRFCCNSCSSHHRHKTK